RQFAFESALVIHLFLEIGKAKICSVEYFEPDAAAFGKALAGKLDPDFGKLVGSNLYCTAVRGQLIRHLQFLQFHHNPLSFLWIDIGVERLILDPVDEIDQNPKQNQDEAGRTRQSQFLLKRKAREECFDLVNWSWSWSGHWVLLNLNHTCDFIIS